jgi:hypothetical protein
MVEGCGCSRQIFGSVDHCADAMEVQLEDDFAEARAAGLTYDAECMAEQVNLYTVEFECSTLSELTQGNLVALDIPTCKVYSGTAQLGEPCELFPTVFADTCAPELVCLGSMCAMGFPERNDRAQGEACDIQTDLCEPGTACLAPPEDPTATTCLRLPGEGEVCTVGCELGLLCERPEGATEARCVPPPGVGQECGSYPTECATGAYCEANTCQATLAPGQPCGGFRDEACGLGYVCDEEEDGGEEVCVPEEAYVCL